MFFCLYLIERQKYKKINYYEKYIIFLKIKNIIIYTSFVIANFRCDFIKFRDWRIKVLVSLMIYRKSTVFRVPLSLALARLI